MFSLVRKRVVAALILAIGVAVVSVVGGGIDRVSSAADYTVYLPIVMELGTPNSGGLPTDTATPTIAPGPSSTPEPTPSPALVNVPIVFVSRQIPPDGSDYMPSTNGMPEVGSYSRFRPAAPGKLIIRDPDGSLHVLVDGSHPTAASLNLIDVNAPAVSYDGRTIVFAGLPNGTYNSDPRAAPGAWRIFAIGVDGTGLRQITFDRPPLDCSQFGGMASLCNTYDDTDPAWLPDGRIVFSSTRWPETAQYFGVRATNLYVVNADGSNLHRITSERNGADRPLIDPVTGKIVFARWWRNDRFAVNSMSTILFNPSDPTQGYVQYEGLTSDRAAEVGGYDNLNRNFWMAASINPDGTDLQAWRMTYRDMDSNGYYGGTFTPSGVLFGNFFPLSDLAESGGFGGIRRLVRGFVPYTPVIGVTTGYNHHLVVTDPPSYGVYPGPYATDPAVLPDGRLVISWAADTTQDYGLYVVNQNGTGLTRLYDSPGTDELRAQVVESRPLPPIIPDTVTQVAPALPPTAAGPYDTGGTFTFQDLNVYFNAPVDAPIVNAPPVGSASEIRFFLDQQRTGNGSIPNTDWPILLAELPVNPDGSVTNPNAPADVPTFEQLRSADGTVPLTHDAQGVNGAAHVAGMNYGRPGTVVQCVGCHAGHSAIPVPSDPTDAQFTNLATGATVAVSSIGSADQAGVTPTAKAINDRLELKEPFGVAWRSAPGQTANQWVSLTFPVPVTISDVRLYDPVGGTDAYGDSDSIHMLDATVVLYADEQATQQVGSETVGPLSTQGTDVPFPKVTARVVMIKLGQATGDWDGQPAVSLGEVEVIASGGTGS